MRFNLLLVTVCCVSEAFAQAEALNPARPWVTVGNTTTNPATNFIGTIDAQDMVIRTGNVERLRVLSLGNVGIGIPAPTELLHVAGNMRLDNAFMPGNDAGTSGQILKSLGPGVAPTWVNLGAYSIANNENLPDNFIGLCSSSSTFTNNTAQAIPDVAFIDVIIPVAGLATSICGVTLTINVNHTWDADLDISLISPLGTVIDVTSDNGGTGDNYTNTVFDDNAATAVTAGVAPFNGTYRPEVPFSTLSGQNPNGNWTLRIADDLAGDVGTYLSSSLTIQTPVAAVFSFVGEVAVPIAVGETAAVQSDYSAKTTNANGIVVRITRDVVSGGGSVGTVVGYCADSGPASNYRSCGISDTDTGLGVGTYYYKLWEYAPASVAGTRNYSLVVTKHN